jgi:hypothetical protein
MNTPERVGMQKGSNRSSINSVAACRLPIERFTQRSVAGSLGCQRTERGPADRTFHRNLIRERQAGHFVNDFTLRVPNFDVLPKCIIGKQLNVP